MGVPANKGMITIVGVELASDYILGRRIITYLKAEPLGVLLLSSIALRI